MKSIIFVTLILILNVILGTLIFWGLGNLIIHIFEINYVWTIWYALVCDIIYMLAKDIFGRK